ncbi:ABC transporter ATP-binding protein [Ornithobacterium rhinotracheale]|uniref:ABC-F family ATP-binding cassette domain-containing protein n=1 Tax=Ornithobacterium rhinotracheale TaxID=28251 RepID=UPI00129CDA3D|nr:ABC-F family ATP-binding cassette domain-containing protein [Ornithobacterium rhinotracheale]MRJ09796.1 ABC transporter ATP-binding protein [Ornithobacterium rhinotracheale]
MNYITAENLTKSYGLKVLFKDISFHINEGDKIALVAKNGSGKSTLLKIIMGIEPCDEGTISINKDIQTVFFDQEIKFNPELSIEDFMMQLEIPPIIALKNYQKIMHSGDTEKLSQAIAEMEHHKAWELETEMQQILGQLKITDLKKKMGKLSGGEVKRVALAKLLLEIRAEHKHTLLIMDEPTNHLDVDMVEWLEQYLSMAKVTLLLVTHDRYFLDNICDIIWELEDQKLYIHRGAYADYLENKALREENLQANIDKANNLYRKELEWMRRQPKARTGKSKSRIEAFYETEKVAKQNVAKENLNLDFEMKRLGKKILSIKNLNKSFSEKVILKDFSYNFQRGEKVGIIGGNGVGKSTFLNIIQGLEPYDSGEIETGETIKIGYFSQKGLAFKEEERVIDFIKEIAENYPLANGRSLSASQFLRLFLFDDQTQYSPISKLSGGEKRRLHLMYVLYQNPNFLIFDEPTNDLDLQTLTVLENFLQQYQGCLIIVSHDRYFMDRIIEHTLVFEGEGVVSDFVGNFTEYRALTKEKAQQQREQAPRKKPAPAKAEAPKKKLSFKEKREFEQLEKELPLLEEKKEALSNQLLGETDYEKIKEIGEELQQITDELEEKEMRWLELSEYV